MRKLFIIFVTGLLVLTGGKAFANQLLTNGDFENGLPAGWTNLGPNWIPQTTVVHPGSGTIAVQNTISTLTPPQNYFASQSQIIPIAGGTTTYYATVFAKSNFSIPSHAVAGVSLQFLNGTTPVGDPIQTQIGGVTDWRQLYVQAAVPGGVNNVQYSVFVFAPQNETQSGGIALGGVAYFDDAVLSSTPLTPPPPQTALINPSFENGLNDWTLIFSPSFSADTNAPAQGVYSAKSVFSIPTTPGQDFFAGAYQDLTYLSGPVYAAAKIKTAISPATTAAAGLKLEFYNASGIQIGETPPQQLLGNNGWTQVIINGYTPPAFTAKIRVMVFTYSPLAQSGTTNGNTANFDDVIFSYSPISTTFDTSLQNGGFENGLNSWHDLFGFPASTSSIAHGGIVSAKKTIGVVTNGSGTPVDYFSQIYQDVYANTNGTTPYALGTPVYASAYVKTAMNPVTKSKAGLQLEYINSNGQVISRGTGPIVVNSGVGGNTDWRYVAVAGTTPLGTVRVRVSGFEFARVQDASLLGDAYYDDVVFSLTPLPIPAKTKLINQGFENGLNDWDELNFPGEVNTVPANIHSGNYSAVYQIPSLPLTQNYFGTASQDMIIPGGNAVKVAFSGWVKTEINPLSTGSAGISLKFLDANNVQVGPEYTQSIGGVTNWTNLVIKQPRPAGAVKVRAAFFLFVPQGSAHTGDKAYFDDGAFRGGPTPAHPCPITGPCP